MPCGVTMDPVVSASLNLPLSEISLFSYLPWFSLSDPAAPSPQLEYTVTPPLPRQEGPSGT